MEAIVKAGIIMGGFAVVVLSFAVGNNWIRGQGRSAKQWVDLLATCFGAASFLTALMSISGLIRHHEGRWLLDYPMIGELSWSTIVLPVLVAIGLGLSLSKRWSDLVQARNL